MSVALDNTVLRKLINDPSGWNSLENSIHFYWPTLFEYLGLGSLFEEFHLFDEKNPLYQLMISSLSSGVEDDALIRLYDQVFVECLTDVKALPQIDSIYLLDQIRKRKSASLFSETLAQYENRFATHSADAMHDLILYFAWDRVCVNLAIVFEHPSTELKGLQVLRECLLESFQHITAHGRTRPDFFRLLEALYAFEMRQENLDLHTEEEWKILCQGASVLRPRNQLVDVHYLNSQKDVSEVLTMDTPEQVKAAQALARCLINKYNGLGFIANDVPVTSIK